MAYNRVFVTLVWRDAYNRTKSKRVEMLTTDAATAETDAATIQAAYQALTDGHIFKALVTGELLYAGAPVAGSNVDTGCTISAQLDGKPSTASIKFPTPKAAIFNPDATVDLTHADVAVLQAIYDTALSQQALISDGDSVDYFIKGVLDK